MGSMAGCCRSGVCEEMFNPRKARANLRRYRKKGLDKLEREMVLTAATQPLTGARILEIGGGIGTIQAELVASGASNGEIVELVSAYEPYARELARDKGIEGRSTFRVADVLEQPGSVAPADIVILNRVVCCSPDGIRLTAVAGPESDAPHPPNILFIVLDDARAEGVMDVPEVLPATEDGPLLQ